MEGAAGEVGDVRAGRFLCRSCRFSAPGLSIMVSVWGGAGCSLLKLIFLRSCDRRSVRDIGALSGADDEFSLLSGLFIRDFAYHYFFVVVGITNCGLAPCVT